MLTPNQRIAQNNDAKKNFSLSFPLSLYFHAGVDSIILDYLSYGLKLKKEYCTLKAFTLFNDKNILPNILARHILWAKDPSLIESFLHNNIHLLDYYVEATDPAGRKRKRTLYQHALAAGDIEMVKKIKNVFVQNKKISEEEKQRKEQFPQGWEKVVLERLVEDMLALDNVINFIVAAKSKVIQELKLECEESINIFKNYFTKYNEMPSIGFDFDMQFLQFVVQRLAENTHESDFLWGEKGEKSDLYCTEILAFTQSLVSARDAQCIVYGLSFIVDDYNKLLIKEEKNVPRNLILDNGKHYYKAFKEKQKGSSRFVTLKGEHTWMMTRRSMIQKTAEVMQNYVNRKNKNFEELGLNYQSLLLKS